MNRPALRERAWQSINQVLEDNQYAAWCLRILGKESRPVSDAEVCQTLGFGETHSYKGEQFKSQVADYDEANQAKENSKNVFKLQQDPETSKAYLREHPRQSKRLRRTRSWTALRNMRSEFHSSMGETNPSADPLDVPSGESSTVDENDREVLAESIKTHQWEPDQDVEGEREPSDGQDFITSNSAD
jgi:hypothetical protein